MNAPPPMGYYAPPESDGALPTVILLYRVYAAVVAIGYVLVAVRMLGQAQHYANPTASELMSSLLTFAPLGFAALHLGGAIVPRRPWGWIYGLVVLALGLPSCLIVFALPLLIFWLKPTCKAAFQRF